MFFVVLFELCFGSFVLHVCVKDVEEEGDDENDLDNDTPFEHAKTAERGGGLDTDLSCWNGGRMCGWVVVVVVNAGED